MPVPQITGSGECGLATFAQALPHNRILVVPAVLLNDYQTVELHTS